MYTEKDLVRIAKRENNTKRHYLVVNQLQGKHIPVSASKAFAMFDELASSVQNAYKNEKLLLVGFAETATAIGARLAVKLNSRYIQTTREKIDGVEYLYFTESHSHATEQKLVKDDIDKVIDTISRIVFVEDEVTTGNTIMKIINILEKKYPDKIKFSVASLLNGMDEESLNTYHSKDIDIHYLVKTNHSKYTDIANGFSGDGKYIDENNTNTDCQIINISGALNSRRCVYGSEYELACAKLSEQIFSSLELDTLKNILVIGTEECMYPALSTAFALENKNFTVKSHSTTRSPIAVSTEENYPLSTRYSLTSLYDDDRKTFIYNLQKYDKVVIITDSANQSKKGLNSLINALTMNGNTNITVYRWCE